MILKGLWRDKLAERCRAGNGTRGGMQMDECQGGVGTYLGSQGCPGGAW